MSLADAVYLMAVGALVCFVFALEPLWERLHRFLTRHDHIEDHGRTRLGMKSAPAQHGTAGGMTTRRNPSWQRRR